MEHVCDVRLDMDTVAGRLFYLFYYFIFLGLVRAECLQW